MAAVRLVVVTGQIDDIVVECLRGHFPGWQWSQEDEVTATGVWRQDYFDCLFSPKADFNILNDWQSIAGYREFNVIP